MLAPSSIDTVPPRRPSNRWFGVFGPMITTAWLGACAIPVRAIGVVRPAGEAAVITSTEGFTRPLMLEGDAAPIRWLDGHVVEVEGVTRRGAIRVQRWHVTEGLHGLSVWVGTLVARPNGLSLIEIDGGAEFQLDPEASEDLQAWVGQVVLLEGLIQGTLGVKVMFYRPLFDEAQAL
jgi:hypothetical protein